MIRNDLDKKPNMFEGDTWTQVQSRGALPILIKYAEAHKTLNFKELANALGLESYIYALNMIPVCQCIRTTLYELESSKEWQHDAIPNITSIIIKSTGEPASFITDELRKVLKREPTEEDYQEEYKASFHYKKWDAVLDALGLQTFFQ